MDTQGISAVEKRMSETVLQRAGRIFSTMSFGTRIGAAAAVALLALGTAWLVYATGGVRFAYLHLMYIPIMLGGLAFGVPGGVAAGVLGGLLIGPLMPIDTATGEIQQTINWTYRLAFFTLNGALAGAGAQLLRRHLRELEWLHTHHPETGLLNSSGLLKELEELLPSKNGDEKLVIFVIQLNNFLEIQNTFGPGFGTRLLLQVVKRMREVIPCGSLLALLQPDRLATVVVSEAGAQDTGNQLEAAAKDSYMLDGVPIHVDMGIGIAHFPNHARSPEELLQKASIAMHWATTSKSSISLYDSGNDRTSRDNLILLGALPDAIANSELRIWHQAKLALATGEITGTEALLRWQHPERGLVLPGSFVPQLEETTLINSVTQWVIGAAFADAADWRAKGYRLRVSVNLSVRNLRGGALLDVLEENLRRRGLDPEGIELEITESAVMSDPDYCIQLIASLRERGYRVSIDDFGVGQSSLSYLRKLRVSDLKIDQEFVKNLVTDTNNQKIVRSILHLARSMGLATIAEGVEDDQTAALLRDWGCDYAQGYGIHRPAPFADLLRFIDSRNPEAHAINRSL